MAEEHKATQHGQVGYAKNLRHGSVGNWHSGQPEQAHHRGKNIHAGGRQGHEQKECNGRCTRQVNERQNVFLGQSLSQHAGGIGAGDIEQPDQSQRVAGDLG